MRKNFIASVLIALLAIVFPASLQAQVAELEGKVLVKVGTAATSTLKESQWYMLYNRGRACYNHEVLADKLVFQSANKPLAGVDIVGDVLGYLVRLVPVTDGVDGRYYIQTGNGNYYGVLEQESQPVMTEDLAHRGVFTITKCGASGHWSLMSEGGFLLDGDGDGSLAVGYGNEVPTKAGGNNDHSFFIVTIGEESELTGSSLVNRKLAKGGLYRLVPQRTTTNSMASVGGKVVAEATDNDDESQLWIIQSIPTGGFSLRNYGDGQYVQNTTASAQYTLGAERSTLYMKPSARTSSKKSLTAISSKSDYSGKTFMHEDASHKVVNWSANDTENANPGSDWDLQDVENVPTTVQIKDHLDEVCGLVKPADGLTVQIRNCDTGRNIAEDTRGNLITSVADAEDYSQYWVIEALTGGNFALRNVKTGHYVYPQDGMRTAIGTTTRNMASIVLKESDESWERTYHIIGSGLNYCLSNAPDNVVFNFMPSDPASRWQFMATNLSAEEIEKAQADYIAYNDIKQNLSQYNASFVTFFTDASCSELLPTYQNMSDDELRAQFKRLNLPDYLLNIALKVKNDKWSEECELAKHYRVNEFKAYSSRIFSASSVGMGYWYGRLSNPTGITVKGGSVLTVFCSNAQPANTTFQLEIVKGTNSTGDVLNLNKGLNIFTFTEDANVFIFYEISNLDTPLASCPDIKVHFEGGYVNGYYDKTRGDNNETWACLREKHLKYSPVINLKTDHYVFHMNSKLVQKACPTDMEKLMALWDNMAEIEDGLMGVNDTYIPGYSAKYRNIFVCHSMTHDFMYATQSGTFYEESTLGTVMSVSGMSGGGIWGPAHENGHLHQNLINMVGTTESSNNLFANVCVYNQGMTTQRAAAPATIYNNFSQGFNWYEYDIWETTHMFYQLYLYYHVNGVMPDFYPRLFAKLRKDPMDQKNSNDIRGKNEYLKFARAVCEIAQADLSEFFDVYGFFKPVDKYHVGDYGNYTITTTQDDINETLEYMHSFPNKMGNILFIEDRVEHVLATYEGHKEGEYKSRRGDDQLGSNQMAGDVGQYVSYLETPAISDYYYTMNASGKVSIIGQGAKGLVGFKVYDENGRLAFVSNWFTFTLPSNIRNQKFRLVAAMADGTDAELSSELPEGIINTEFTQPVQPGLIYDLQGRKVEFPVRGNLYIISGKKSIY